MCFPQNGSNLPVKDMTRVKANSRPFRQNGNYLPYFVTLVIFILYFISKNSILYYLSIIFIIAVFSLFHNHGEYTRASKLTPVLSCSIILMGVGKKKNSQTKKLKTIRPIKIPITKISVFLNI
jgi:hypothetical protein